MKIKPKKQENKPSVWIPTANNIDIYDKEVEKLCQHVD